MRRTTGIVAAAVIAGIGIAGCGNQAISQDELEETSMDELEEMAGQRPDEVSCEGDLEATVDEAQRCELTAGPDQIGFTVTVMDVDDNEVRYEIEVDDEVAS